MEGRQASCPNCGATIAWRLGTSAAVVCGHCRHSVVRSDRGIQSYGKIADLVPTAAPLAVGDTGTIGRRGFQVIGRMQLDHGRGPWDEWLVAYNQGGWAWLARAQGKWYLTEHAQNKTAPALESLQPGAAVPLVGEQRVWQVQEIGASTVVSAEGELPFATYPGARGRYVDIVATGGGFGTIDYGDGRAAPVVFLGEELAAGVLQWTAGMGPRPTQEVQVQELSCPSCAAPCPIRVPDRTERVTCSYCGGVLDYQQGALAKIGQLDKPKIFPTIPLGAAGKLFGDEYLCIGFMQRYVYSDGKYSWHEYLLHSKEKGYRWLMCDSGHWLFMEPVNAAEVACDHATASFQGRSHKLFNMANPMVEWVVGEFYWRVQIGDKSSARDFINPPTMLSEESTAQEVNWSLGRYVEPKTISEAFDLEHPLRAAWDVAPAQPNPSKPLIPFLVAVALTVIASLVHTFTAYDVPEQLILSHDIEFSDEEEAAIEAKYTGGPRSLDPDGDGSEVEFTERFELPEKARALEVKLQGDNRYWVGTACALVDEKTGERREFTLENDDYYTRYPDNDVKAVMLDDLDDAHKYRIRVDARWASKTEKDPPTSRLEITSKEAYLGPGPLIGVLFLLWLPIGFVVVRWHLFEQRRWRNSSLS